MNKVVHDILANIIGAILCFAVLCIINLIFGETVNFKMNAIVAVVIVAVQAFVGFLRKNKGDSN